VPKHLPQTPLHDIAHDRVAHLTAHRKAKPSMSEFILPKTQRADRCTNTNAPALHATNVTAFTEAIRARVAKRKLGKHRNQCFLLAVETVRLARPFARRRRITARPLGVFMRARKPWVRRRLRFEGWKVRFMTISLGFRDAAGLDHCHAPGSQFTAAHYRDQVPRSRYGTNHIQRLYRETYPQRL
jgi:hypothetical protein